MRAGREYALKRALDKLDAVDPFDVVIIDPAVAGRADPQRAHRRRRGDRAAAVRDAGAPRRGSVPPHRRRRAAEITNPKLTLLGALPTLYDSRTTHSRDVLFDVADRYDLPVLSPPIPRTVWFAEASASRLVGDRRAQEQGRLGVQGSWPTACSSTGSPARRCRPSAPRSEIPTECPFRRGSSSIPCGNGHSTQGLRPVRGDAPVALLEDHPDPTPPASPARFPKVVGG